MTESQLKPGKKKEQSSFWAIFLLFVLLLFGLVLLWFGLVLGFSSVFEKGYLSWKFEVEKRTNFDAFLWQHTSMVFITYISTALMDRPVFLHMKKQRRKKRLQHSDLCTWSIVWRDLSLLSLMQFFPSWSNSLNKKNHV